jgi:hypothetical protein
MSKSYMRLIKSDEQPRPVPIVGIFVKSKRCKASVLLVDTAGIEGKKMQLPFGKLRASPGEISKATSWQIGEVSRGHSSQIPDNLMKDRTIMVFNRQRSIDMLRIVFQYECSP